MTRTPVFIYQCPVCNKRVRWKDKYEPGCTGPSESRHDHPPVVMRLLKIADDQISPALAEKKAKGPLILPPEYKP